MEGTTTATAAHDVSKGREACLIVPEVHFLPCTNSSSVMTLETRELLENVVYVGLLPLLFVTGTLANTLSLLIFLRQGLRDHVTATLFCLGVADLLYLVVISLRYSEKMVSLVLGSWWYDLWLASLVRYRLVAVQAGFSLASNFISMFIAVDRCLCVLFPLHLQRMRISFKHTISVVVIGCVVNCLGIQSLAFMYDVTCAVYVGKTMNTTDVIITPSALYKDNKMLMDVLDVFIFSTLVPGGSLVIVASSTIVTAVQLRLAVRWRSKTNASAVSVKETALTRMLIVISGIYIVCVGPRVPLSLLRLLVPGFQVWGRHCNLVVTTDALMNVLLALNSALNFFVYVTLSSKFKDTLQKTLCCDARRGFPRVPVTMRRRQNRNV